jgi:hypothetical protein
VFFIHGDGDYRYHDTRGNAHQADDDVLSQAQRVAQLNPQAEVFIFHEIARRHVLFLIPRKDGRAWHYVGGRLVGEKSYWRDQGESSFDPEVRLYEEFGGPRSRPSVRMFLYFGHELPEFNGAGYSASYSKRRVTIHDVAEALRSIAGDSKIDLVILGTCYGGTPHTIGALAPYARTIIASPDNLHLSYFDLEPLMSLHVGEGGGEVAAFADGFAHHAFEKLSSEVQTAVSVVVYDAAGVGEYVASVADAYDRSLAVANVASPAAVGHCDCAEDSSFVAPEMSQGLTVLYRAARFGRAKLKPDHSGWECWHIAK